MIDADDWKTRYEREYDVVDRVWKAVRGGDGYKGEELSAIVTDYVKRAQVAESALSEARAEIAKLTKEVSRFRHDGLTNIYGRIVSKLEAGVSDEEARNLLAATVECFQRWSDDETP
jgi:hypothetical protein